MKAQELYDLREKFEFCSGIDLHEFFYHELGDGSPSGYREIDQGSAKSLVIAHLKKMEANNGGTLDGLYTPEEQADLTRLW